MTRPDDNHDEIIAGIERIRNEKPYADAADAISALDWIGSATAELRREQKKLADSDILLFGRLGKTLAALDSLHESIQSRMDVNDQKVPNRHGGPSSDALDVDELS
jgi:hypothetical protein